VPFRVTSFEVGITFGAVPDIRCLMRRRLVNVTRHSAADSHIEIQFLKEDTGRVGAAPGAMVWILRHEKSAARPRTQHR